LQLCLPATEGFAPNINVQIQPYTGLIKDYATLFNVILVSMSKARPEVVLANERRTLHFATVQTFQDRKAELIE
jgi:hypothetical protein